MHQQEQDEELIAAFKLFGASDVRDTITFDALKNSLSDLDPGEFNDEELKIIFDEIAGASKKPNMKMRAPSVGVQRDNLNGDSVNENGERGINFTDFMLMMMAK